MSFARSGRPTKRRNNHEQALPGGVRTTCGGLTSHCKPTVEAVAVAVTVAAVAAVAALAALAAVAVAVAVVEVRVAVVVVVVVVMEVVEKILISFHGAAGETRVLLVAWAPATFQLKRRSQQHEYWITGTKRSQTDEVLVEAINATTSSALMESRCAWDLSSTSKSRTS